MNVDISRHKRDEIVDALRRGTVPQRGLEVLAVGLDRFDRALDEELARVRQGAGVFKAVRGEYGSGKTFFARFVQERAKRLGFATSEVQISETETPLHRLETVYRRLMERLSTADQHQGAFRSIIDGWFFALEEDVLRDGGVEASDTPALLERTTALMESRLALVSRTAPSFATALRGYREALAAGDTTGAESLLAWLAGQPNVGAAAKRDAGLKGDVDHFGALGFLQGLLVVLRDACSAGLVLVLDEVETLQRVRADARDKALNALRQLVDEVDAGRFPGLFLLITGTQAFFDGPQGVKRLPPLAQRLQVDFQTDARFDNPRAVQIRLQGFHYDGLCEVGRRVRDIYGIGASAPERVRRIADDQYIEALARAVAGSLGGKVGIAPRVFLKKLVGEVLDRIDQFDDFDPRQHYSLTVTPDELTKTERAAMEARSVDEIELDIDGE